MRKKKSIDWISAYVFNNVENKCFKALQHNVWDTEVIQTPIPKVLFGLTATKSDEVTITEDVKKELHESILNDCNEIFFDRFQFTINIYPKNQYIWIEISAKRKPKKMTLEEIEHALGYKVEIISEKKRG